MNKLRYKPSQMIEALESTRGMVTLAAERLRCEPDTIYNYIKRYPTVAAELKRQRERTTDIAELKLYQAINDGESWAVQFYLRTQAKHRGYVERQEITGADGAPFTIHLTWDEHARHDPALDDSPPALTSGATNGAPEPDPV